MQDNLKKVVIAACVLTMGPISLFAMPTAKEIEKVAPIVEELMKADIAKMKQGTAKAGDVAEAALALAKAADTQAAKYYLLTSAVPYFAKDGRYDRIVATVEAIKTAVPDIPMKELVKTVEPVVSRAPKTDVSANRLRAMVSEYRAKEKSEAQAEKMRQAIAKNPADKSLHTKLAEYMAVVGNWEVALSEFAQGDNRAAAKTAKDEKSVGGGANVGELADFWWGYADGRSKTVAAAIRQHAVDLYKTGIAEGKITGLAKVQAERRIVEFGAVKTAPQAAPKGETVMAEAPSVMSNAAREFTLGAGVKMAFQSCAGGSFTMGWPEAELADYPQIASVFRPSEVKISKQFWMAETLVSERVWGEVMGEKCDGQEPRAVTFEEAGKFLEKFRGKVAGKIPGGYMVRLPTYAEYEYALKAGGAEQGSPFAKPNPDGEEAGAIRQVVDADVSSPTPNSWGLRGLRMKGGTVWLEDRLAFDKKEMSPTGYRWDATGMRVNRINWPKSSVDPLIPLGGGQTFPVYLLDRGFFQPYGANGGAKAFLRLVLAPKPKDGKK